MPSSGVRDAGRRILLLSFDIIGPRLGGAAIRVLGLARALAAQGHSPTLAAPELEEGAEPEPFPICRFDLSRARAQIGPLLANADVAVLPMHALKRLPFLQRAKMPLVFDLYDPVLFELEASNADSAEIESHRQMLNHVLRRGDFFLCATERQREYLADALKAKGRGEDLIAVVPFGIDPIPAPPHDSARNFFPEIPKEEKIIVWPGGIWDWTDPRTLLAAMRRLEDTAIHLVFFAGKHPGLAHAETAATRCTRAEAGHNVHFIDNYIPYRQRGNFLAECDAAVSTHRANSESYFAYRTRLLDCIWAALPIVCTEGDIMAELVVRRGLGLVVPPENPEALAEALEQIVLDTNFAANCRRHLGECRADFDWNKAVMPLARFCQQPRLTHAATPLADARTLLGDAARVFKKHGARETWRRLRKHLRNC